MRQAPGCGARRITRGGLRRKTRFGAMEARFVIVRTDPQKHPVSRWTALRIGRGRVLKSMPGHFQNPAVLRIHLHRLAFANTEEAGVKRSEEHTSELQSLMRISYAVFCLNNNIYTHNTQTSHISNHTYTTISSI